MKIIKRNGAEESFDTLKIVNAVQKACNATENAYLAPEQLTDIADYVEYKCNKLGRAVSVEEIQDMVENQLMAIGAFAIAKNLCALTAMTALGAESKHDGQPDPVPDRVQQRRGYAGKFQQESDGQQRTA